MKDQVMGMPEQTADAQLVRLSIRGDRRAFEEIVRRNVSSVSAVAYALTGDRSASEDVTQEVFLKAWQRLKDLREPEKLRSWLCVIAQNVANSFGRKTIRDPLCGAEDLRVANEIAIEAPSPADAAIAAEQQQLVWLSIERIPETYRVPLILFYREGRSVAEVASSLDLSDEAVRQRLSRARAMLKDEVAKMVESSITTMRPGKLLVTAIMAGLGGATVQAATAGVATAAATKLAGGAASGVTGLSGAFVVSVLGPLQIVGGFFRFIVRLRTAQSREERRLMLKFAAFFLAELVAFLMVHVGLVRVSAKGLLTNPQSYIAMGFAAVLYIASVILLYRWYRNRDYALLKAGDGALNEVQARRFRLMEASPGEREIGMHVDTIQRFRENPFSAAYAAHGGLVFAGSAWVVVDGTARNDRYLFVGALVAATLVELIAVVRTMQRPQNYLLHRSMMFLSMIPLMAFTVAYWHVQGVTNALLTIPPDNWMVMRVLPALVCIGYVVPAVFNLAKHGRLKDAA